METLGTNYGGWCIPINAKLDNDSIIYSGGVGEDMSFDLKLEDKYKCKIFLIDPTYRAIKHYEEVKEFDTLVIELEQGNCLMQFYHSRWRRANDVQRWNDIFNEYGGCPYVFE